ncbi:MAG: hypothetical protein Q9162_004398 [Coniocarpon cinnabarinum]
MATQTPSHACCTTPPIQGKGYAEKGKFIQVDGMKTYTTGSPTAEKAILFLFDIFGFYPQTLQGADILATGDKEQHYSVFMPDWFDGKPADISWYPPQTEDHGKKLGEFFSNQGAPAKTVARVPKVLDELQQRYPDIKTWGIIGMCWGGKVVNLVSQNQSRFKAAVSAHPAMVDPSDAPGVTIPFLMLPSQGEEQKDVDAWKSKVSGGVKHDVIWFKDQVHGFMAARSDLDDKNVAAAYEKAYLAAMNWFHDYV